MLAVLRQRNFCLLWFGQIISSVGDFALSLALPYYTYQLTGSVLATGIAALATTVPRAILGSVAGVFVDRWNRKWTMMSMDLLRAFLMLLLLLVHAPTEIWLIYVVGALDATCSLFFGPAKSALVPSLVHEQDLTAANALSNIGNNLPRLIGPVIGGVLLGISGGLTGVVFVDSATFLFSGLMIWLISAPAMPSASIKEVPMQTKDAVFAKVWREWIDGLRLVKSQHIILMIFLMISLTEFADYAAGVLLVPFVTHILHSNAVGMSWIFLGRGVGGLLGGVLVGFLSRFVQPAKLLTLGLLADGCLLLLMMSMPSLSMAIACFTFMGIFVLFWVTSYETLLQQQTEDAYRGRVFGAFGATTMASALVGQVLASTTGDHIGITPWFIAWGTLYLSAGMTALMTAHGIMHKEQADGQTPS